MTHTLTFDTDTPGYNHDVDLNITANPFDANGGYYEAEIVLTPGVYRYFRAIPGHRMMWGELVVTDGGGDPDPDTTPPEVTTTVTGDQDEDGSYNGSATVTITATDDDSGIDTVQYTLDDGDWTTYDGPITITQPGRHTTRLNSSHDTSTNTDGSVTNTVVEEDTGPDPDTTPPEDTTTVTGEQDEDGSYIGSATPTVSYPSPSYSMTPTPARTPPHPRSPPPSPVIMLFTEAPAAHRDLPSFPTRRSSDLTPSSTPSTTATGPPTTAPSPSPS